MTNEELISKAKEHARLFINQMPVDPKIIDGIARVREAVIIYFGDDNELLFKVTLDKKTGDFITAESSN
jgi:hypothetical protein